jgi:type IV pilus assembly protein PilC
VSTGEFLSKAMEETKVFDPMLTSMIEIGEEAGDLEDILQKMSRFFDSESTAATKQLVSLLEPVMLIIMGLVVGVIVVAIMLPMMNMGNVV